MQHLKIFKDQKGILLMEALVALAVIVIVMTALVTALVSAINSTTFSREQSQATAYAQEGLDVARALKNRDFSDFQTTTTYGLCEGALDFSGTPCMIDGKYQRRIYINDSGRDEAGTLACKETNSVFVASIVSWNDSRCSGSVRCHKVALDSCFVNLNFIPAP